MKSFFKKRKDKCIVNPKDCVDGLSFSIWEKVSYMDDILNIRAEHDRKYILSSGGEHADGTNTPGFSLYHIGMDIVAIVSTGDDVWELGVRGQLNNQSWINFGVIWEPVTAMGKDHKGGISVRNHVI